MKRTILEYAISLFLGYVIVSMRNEIFHYNEETGKIDYKIKGILGALFLWFMLMGVIFFMVK